MKSVKCDHCEKDFSIEDKYHHEDPVLYWCGDCVSENVSLLDQVSSKKYNTKFRYWQVQSKIDKLKTIPKKSSDNKPALTKIKDFISSYSPTIPNSNANIKCKRKYYGIECNCGCQITKRQAYNRNVFGYTASEFMK